MAEEEFGITQFVRGMAWHDAGKPFVIDTGPHAVLGYWLLRLAGYPGEAKVVLAHGHSSREKILRDYLKSGGEPLPAALLLCNALDVLSASVYSFQSRRPPDTDCHSMHNPFSRLVMHSAELGGAFAVPHKERVAKLYEPLRQKFEGSLPISWREVVTKSMGEATTISPATLNVSPLPDDRNNQEAIKVIEQFMSHYPERTYPAVNDTSLLRHCRLSGILAFVVYRNLEEDKSKNWLESFVTFEEGQFKRPTEYDRAAVIVQEHLTASLVRVAFEGHRALYESAARVDDLHGARELTERMLEAFKLALARQLDVPDLADFLAISESQFDLMYLLPPAKVPLETVVHEAYEAAIGRVAGEIADRLKRDFPQITGQREQLRQQLSDLGYGLRIVQVDVPEDVDFDALVAQYGHNLLQAYQKCQEYATFPAASLPDEANWRDRGDTLPAAGTCEVCGNFPILVPPADLGDEARAEWQRKRDYAAHIFRGEREHICLSCVARRTLAYGKIAREMDPIVHPMLQHVKSQPNAWEVMKPPDGPELPPWLASAFSLESDDELRDVGAFYVRYRRIGGHVDRSDLDIFPTTSYAADATGNVVLLSLQPTQALFACYPHDAAIKEFDPDQQTCDSPTDNNVVLWQNTFIRFHNKVAKVTPDLSEPIRHVQPHLARVMERIQRIQTFYHDLYHRLAAGVSRLRVLPLDTDYPTLRLLLPADQLDQVLCVLDRVMAESLFSATCFQDLQERQESHRLLELLVPDLLYGAVVLFKHKFPLYLALEAERHLFHHLEMTDGHRKTSARPSYSDWYGLRLAFTDLRGTLSEVGLKRAEVTYENLGTVLDLAKAVDRRTILLYAETSAYISPELADAQAVVRANRTRLDQHKVQQLEEKGIFQPVLFLKRATRE